jgi:sulfopyruvate decarboxylase subunit alpha
MSAANAVHEQSAPSNVIKPYAQAFMDGLRAANVKIAGALPESHLKSIYVALGEADDITYVRVSNEADLPGLITGAYLGGVRALMISENSGLRQACEPISRLAYSHHMPLVMVVGYRGDFGEGNWWGHNHAQVMTPLLNALRIPFWVIDRVDMLAGAIEKAFVHADASQWPVCLVLTGECSEAGVAA